MTKILKVTIEPNEYYGITDEQVIYAPIAAIRQDAYGTAFVLTSFPISSELFTEDPVYAYVTVRPECVLVFCQYADEDVDGLDFIDTPVKQVEIIDDFPVYFP